MSNYDDLIQMDGSVNCCC